MDLRHLRYLVAVAEAGTFSGAAERLRLAQPALTRQLRDLQDELQATLFEPSARRATLTPAGQAAVRRARELIGDAKRAVERARMAELGLAGRCVVTVGPLAVMSGLAARLVSRIKERYPEIELTVTESGGHQQWVALKRGEADVGLGVAPPAAYVTLRSEPQYSDVVDVALVAPDDPLARQSDVALADLPGSFLALEDMSTEIDDVKRRIVAALGDLRGRGALDVEEAVGVDDLMARVRAGTGWTFVPRLVRNGFPPLVPVRIRDFAATLTTSSVARLNERRPAVLTVLAELREMRHEEGPNARYSAAVGSTDRPSWREMPPRLELRQVRTFAAVARWGSFGRAAAARRITQPAISRQMLHLEQDLRIRLFERGTRGTGLTPAGETFSRDVSGLLKSVERFHNEVKRAERGAQGTVVLGVVPHAEVDRIVSRVLEALCCSGITIQLAPRALTTTQLGEALHDSELDAAIGYTYPMPVAQMDGLVRRPLFTDELNCAMLSASHPLASRRELSLAELREVPFLFPRRAVLPRLYDAVMQQFAAVGTSPRVDAEYHGVQTIWSLTAQGLGWSLGTARQLGSPPRGTVCVPLRDFMLPWGAELVYRSDEDRSTVVRLGVAILEAAGNHSWKSLSSLRR
jgi:DNA-binding transcriptional LysR family regulator